jgi:hypothetical protein
VGDPAPAHGIVGVALGYQLAPGEHVEQPELGEVKPVGGAPCPPHHHRLGADRAPVLVARLGVEVAHAVDERGRVERPE